MTYREISSASSALVFALLLAGCGETDAEQRERMNRVADEIVAIQDINVQVERMAELSEEDMALFGQILDERMAKAKSELAGGSALTQKMIEYAAIDSARADRLVAQCERELGASAVGEEARLIAQCVDAKW